MNSETVVVAAELAVGADPAAPVLSGVELTLAAGERLAVVGANGAGKSALLATLALVAPPLAGRLSLFGRDPAGLAGDARAALRRRIGAALGDELWMANASAAAELALPLRVHGEDAATLHDVVDAFLAWLGLPDRPTAALSEGERRLLATARAAILRPHLLLLDEPLAGLDERAVARTAQLVDELAGLGAAVVVATARPETARRLGCAPVTLAEGRLGVGATPLRAAS